MSSPVHHPNDLDAALRYAPPWARKVASPSATSRGDPDIEISPADLNDGSEPPFDGDRAMLALQRRLSRDANDVLDAPVRLDDRTTLDRIAFRLCTLAGIAALVAWLTISLPTLSISLPFKAQVDEILHAAMTHAAQTRALTATPVKVVHIHSEMMPLPVVMATPAVPATAPVAAAATPQTAPAPVQAAPATDELPQPKAQPTPLAPDEVTMLLKRGKDFLANGDISSARLLLRRAAEAGNSEAALALGSTFDPVVIDRLGAIGVHADTATARKWYEKAAALGSNNASQQIANLAATGR